MSDIVLSISIIFFTYLFIINMISLFYRQYAVYVYAPDVTMLKNVIQVAGAIFGKLSHLVTIGLLASGSLTVATLYYADNNLSSMMLTERSVIRDMFHDILWPPSDLEMKYRYKEDLERYKSKSLNFLHKWKLTYEAGLISLPEFLDIKSKEILDFKETTAHFQALQDKKVTMGQLIKIHY